MFLTLGGWILPPHGLPHEGGDVLSRCIMKAVSPGTRVKHPWQHCSFQPDHPLPQSITPCTPPDTRPFNTSYTCVAHHTRVITHVTRVTLHPRPPPRLRARTGATCTWPRRERSPRGPPHGWACLSMTGECNALLLHCTPLTKLLQQCSNAQSYPLDFSGAPICTYPIQSELSNGT